MVVYFQTFNFFETHSYSSKCLYVLHREWGSPLVASFPGSLPPHVKKLGKELCRLSNCGGGGTWEQNIKLVPLDKIIIQTVLRPNTNSAPRDKVSAYPAHTTLHRLKRPPDDCFISQQPPGCLPSIYGRERHGECTLLALGQGKGTSLLVRREGVGLL